MDDTPIYEALFSLEVALCDRFSGLTPLSLRKERSREVFLLIKRYANYGEKQSNENATSNDKKIGVGEIIIGGKKYKTKQATDWY